MQGLYACLILILIDLFNKLYLFQLLQAIPRSTEVVWMLMAELDKSKLQGGNRVMTNEMLGRYNQAILAALAKSTRPITPWSQFASLANVTGDGMHFDLPSLDVSNEVIL